MSTIILAGQFEVVQQASNAILEQLKAIRSTATGLTTRLKKFKSELEDILADDQDMCAASCSYDVTTRVRQVAFGVSVLCHHASSTE